MKFKKNIRTLVLLFIHEDKKKYNQAMVVNNINAHAQKNTDKCFLNVSFNLIVFFDVIVVRSGS
jgi:hypothetical protein